MLAEITIRDFAIIDQLTISWEAGLNVLTGETGAGKSIIVDAVGALLGDRLGPEVVRAGRDRAFIEGIFDVDFDQPAHAALRELLAEHELAEDDRQIILTREIARTGRSVARINGRAVPLALLQQVGEQLVDVHGQSQHLSLLRVREHLELLDRFAGLTEQRRVLAELVGRWRALQAERKKLQAEIRVAERERELLRHEIAEIEAAQLQPGEEEELLRLRQRLRFAERLRHAVEQALLLLNGLDEQRGAVDLLEEAAMLCADASRADRGLTEPATILERLASEAEEVARDLRRYLDQFDSDPRQLEDVEARFLLLADLKRKYGESIDAILAYLEEARRKLATAEGGAALLETLDARERQLRGEIAAAAFDLSRKRRAAAEALTRAVERELADLNMPNARFGVSIEQQPEEAGIDWPSEDGAQRVAVDASGADRIEFLFSANPGEPPRGLGRIASGGELARVSLALKAVLARADHRVTLVFDEVDVGVGGRSAAVVGQKLWELTRTHQVLCITHMPQVAAFADQHLVIAKEVEGEVTRTSVHALSSDERPAELAAMLGGGPNSRAAEANARELLQRAEAWKRGQTLERAAG